MMQSRTHTCGQLRLADAGKQVTLAGWMENVRVVSAGLAFVVLRDFYGTTQIVADSEEMVNTFKAITKESTISVEGTVPVSYTHLDVYKRQPLNCWAAGWNAPRITRFPVLR